MSALFWLFGLGTLAIGFPFLFHLIRRTPKGQTQFSSLMFLKPSPPTLTRRSRLENLLLLALRMAAILLIAIAFMRPFFRGSDSFSLQDVSNRRVAILVDTSASMQRGELWQKVTAEFEKILRDLEPADSVSLIAFDDRGRSVVGFGVDSTGPGNSDSNSQQTAMREGFKRLHPGWATSDLGNALVSVASQLAQWPEAQRESGMTSNSKLQMIVISDLQKGSKTELLQSFQWPDNVFVDFRIVRPSQNSNATVQVLPPAVDFADSIGADSIGAQSIAARRIRVRSFEDTHDEQFEIIWLKSNQQSGGEPILFHVPADTSQVLVVDDDAMIEAQQFELTGDDHPFDNSYYVVPPQKQNLRVVYYGDESDDDADEMLFYLKRALPNSLTRSIDVLKAITTDPTDPTDPTDLNAAEDSPVTMIVVTSPVSGDQKEHVQEFLNSGGTVVVVLKNRGMVESTSEWTAATPIVTDDADDSNANSKKRYAMLAEIDFSHRIFEPFNSPRFNDFTKIRFWNHQRVEVNESGATKIIARFDDDSPAVWEHHLASGGTVIAMASGWQPAVSQLALSTKFVPILNGLLDIAVDQPDLKRNCLINAPLQFASSNVNRTLHRPDQAQVMIAANQTEYPNTDVPGIYRLESTEEELLFAVNIDRSESETAPIPIEQLEMFGIKVGQQKTAATEIKQLRDLQDRELEDKQKVWKWLILGALAMLIAETWLAGRTSRRQFADVSI